MTKIKNCESSYEIWRIDCMKDNVCPIGVLGEKSEWSHSEVTNEGVVAENIWGEIADDQMQREKDLIADPKRDYLQRNFWPQRKPRPEMVE